MKKTILCFLLLSTSPSLAGNEVGNGGDAVVCLQNNKITSVELLDFYEFKANSSYKILLNKTSSPEEQIESLLSILNQHSKRLATHYKNKVQNFMKDTNFVENKKLKNIKDSKHLFMPNNKNCRVEQIAVYIKNPVDKKKFIINKNLWNKMDNTNKAGLILHEIIYEHFYKLGEKDSIKARHINALFFSNQFKTLSTKEFWQKLKDLKIPIYKE